MCGKGLYIIIMILLKRPAGLVRTFIVLLIPHVGDFIMKCSVSRAYVPGKKVCQGVKHLEHDWRHADLGLLLGTSPH